MLDEGIDQSNKSVSLLSSGLRRSLYVAAVALECLLWQDVIDGE